MVQSPSWEANWFAASQEIPRISRNPKVHYRTHKRPPPVSILGPPNPVHIPTSHLLEIHPNIIHPSTPRSPQWSVSLRFPHQDPIRPPLLTHTHHMPSPSHSSTFFVAQQPYWGLDSHLIVEVSRSHLDAPHSLGLGRRIGLSQRPLPDNTRHSQETDFHVPGAIQSCNPRKRATAERVAVLLSHIVNTTIGSMHHGQR